MNKPLFSATALLLSALSFAACSGGVAPSPSPSAPATAGATASPIVTPPPSPTAGAPSPSGSGAAPSPAGSGAVPPPVGSGSPAPGGSGAPSDPAALAGRTFLSTSVSQGGVDRPLVANTRIRLTFGEGGQLGVAAGCNSMGAAYQIADAKLEIADAASTMIGCKPPLQAQDEWVFGFMGSSPTVALAGNDLTLTGDGLVIQLVDEEQAVPDMGLAGPAWTVTTVLTGDIASSVPMGIVATLRFGEDGSVNVATGCNTGSGSYTVDGTNIAFGPIALTKMGCSGGAGQMERFVVGVLESQALTFAIDGSSLTLSAGGNGLILTGE